MYNEKIKRRYIEHSNQPLNVERAFKRTEPLENLLGKDIYDFSEKELEKLFLMSNTPSVTTMASYVSILRSYTEWAINNNLVADGINHLIFFTVDILDRYINKFWANEKVLSYVHYKKMIDLLEDYDQKFILGCLWNGIGGPSYLEIGLSKVEDFDKENLAIRVYRLNEEGDKEYHRTVPVDEETIRYGEISSETYQMIRVEKGDKEKQYQLSGNTVIKAIDKTNNAFTAHNIYHRIYNKIQLIKNAFELDSLTPKSITISGMVYKLKLISERNGTNIMETLKSEEGRKILYDYDQPLRFTSLERKIKPYW